MDKIPRYWLWILAAVVGIAAYLNLGGDSTATGANKKPKPKAVASNSKSDFTDEDYKVHFGPLTAVSMKTSFVPVVKRDSASGAGTDANPNAIPASFAGGESNWSFTGTAVVDGASMALVENSQSHDGDFVRIGQAWKGSLVVSIAGDSITLSSGGDQMEFHARRIEPESKASVATTAPNQPFNPMGAGASVVGVGNPFGGSIGGGNPQPMGGAPGAPGAAPATPVAPPARGGTPQGGTSRGRRSRG